MEFEIENGVLKKYNGRERNVIIPDTVTSIGEEAFQNCSSLTSVIIPNSVTNMGLSVFRKCVSLAHVIIGNGLTKLEVNTFEECRSLKTISIPDGITMLDFCSLSTNAELHIYFGANVAKLEAFTMTLARKDFGPKEEFPYSATLQNGVTEIGEAFCRSVGLKEINIPATVERVNARAFYGCKNLQVLTIEEGVKYISEFAFAGCASLKEVVFPDSMEAIEASAFFDCKKLKKVSIPWNCSFDATSFPHGLKVNRRK